jgi:rubredoxin
MKNFYLYLSLLLISTFIICEEEFISEKNIIIINNKNFDKAIQKYDYLLVLFYLPFNPQWFKKKAMSILEQVEKEWGWMYETEVNGKTAKVNFTVWSDDFSCPSCGGELNYWDAAVDLENEIIRDDFECPHCGTHVTKKDLNRLWVTKYDELLKDAVPQIHKTPILVNYTLNGKRGENAPTEKDIDKGLSAVGGINTPPSTFVSTLASPYISKLIFHSLVSQSGFTAASNPISKETLNPILI